MTVALRGGLSIPPLHWYQSDSAASTDMSSVSALSGERVGFVIRAPKSGVIDGFEFGANLFWSLTHPFIAEIWTVSESTGLPTASLGTAGPFSGVSVGSWATMITGLGVNVLAGQLIGCVLHFTGVGGITMRTILRPGSVAFPYAVNTTAAVWTRAVSTHQPELILKYSGSDPITPLGCVPHLSERLFVDTARNVTNTAKSATFTLPWTTDVSGVQVFLNGVVSGASSVFTVSLKQGATTLGSADLDSEYLEDVNRGWFLASFPTVSLTANVEYTLEIDVAGTVAVYEQQYTGATQLSLNPGSATFGVWDGNSNNHLRFSLLGVPQSVPPPEPPTPPVTPVCGRGITPTICETPIPADPAIVVDTSATAVPALWGFLWPFVFGNGAAVGVMVQPTACTPFVPSFCQTSVPPDP